jgi:uncharacterized protein YlzI (FlbEa/FlbD family)
MIPVTPLDGRSILMSVRSIEQIEETPETVLVLAGGRRMVVVDLAQDLVNRIKRIQARVLATAAAPTKRTEYEASESRSVALIEATPAPFTDAASTVTDHAAAESEATPRVSSVNLLHIGQATLDRVLASIARCRWDESGATSGHIRQELAKAIDGLNQLTRSLDDRHPSEVTQSVADILAECTDQLARLYSQPEETLARHEVDTALHAIYVNLTKLRKVWARIAADNSWSQWDSR